MVFVLEVVRFIKDKDEWIQKNAKFEHVGYMRARFETTENAASYYGRHNPHLRKLNVHGTWCSS